MTRRHILILLTIGIALTLQFLVPILQYPNDGANRWGWQMYSRENPNPDIYAIDNTGQRDEVDLANHLFHRRGEIRIDDHLLVQLCDRIDKVKALELVREADDEVVVHQCPG